MSTMIATTPPTSAPAARTASAGPGDGGAAFGDVLAGSRVAAGAGARSGRLHPSQAAPHHGTTTAEQHHRGRDGVDAGVDAGGAAVVGSREHGAATGDAPTTPDGAAVAADAAGTTPPASASSASTAGAVPFAVLAAGPVLATTPPGVPSTPPVVPATDGHALVGTSGAAVGTSAAADRGAVADAIAADQLVGGPLASSTATGATAAVGTPTSGGPSGASSAATPAGAPLHDDAPTPTAATTAGPATTAPGTAAADVPPGTDTARTPAMTAVTASATAATAFPTGATTTTTAGRAAAHSAGSAPVVAASTTATATAAESASAATSASAPESGTGAPPVPTAPTRPESTTGAAGGAGQGATVAPAAASSGHAGGNATGTGSDRRPSTGAEPSLRAVDGARSGAAPAAFPTPSTTGPTAATPSGAATANAAPATFTQQLARPVFTLAHAGPGEHLVTVQVTPDALGPVTVRAHVTAHSMHVELFAPSDAGREAVRQVLPDLRRDAAGTGLSTTLDLSSQNHPDSAPGRDERPAPGPQVLRDDREARPEPATHRTPSTTTVRTAGLDVLA